MKVTIYYVLNKMGLFIQIEAINWIAAVDMFRHNPETADALILSVTTNALGTTANNIYDHETMRHKLIANVARSV